MIWGMQCPADGSTLVMSERSGIEIDYCPQCRGVWLDRGELDKIIERSVSPQSQNAGQDRYAPPAYDRREERPRYEEQRYDDRGYGGQKRKRESWLSELFD